MTDFDTIMMQPLDPAIDGFLADDTADIAFAVSPPAVVPGPFLTTSPTATPVSGAPTPDPPTSAPVAAIPPGTSADMGMILLKPNPDLVANITDAFLNTAYDPATGWDGSDAGAFDGSLGMAGILTHYYTTVAPEKLKILDHCTYGNDHSGDCLDKPTGDVAVAKMSTCGQPWTCPDLSGLSPAERAQCEVFEKLWFETRKDFEDNCWIGGPTSSRDGAFQSEVSLGFCNGTGIMNYNRLITDKPAPFSCDPDIQTNYVTSILSYGNGRFQNQKLTLKTGEHTGQPDICVSGTVLKAGFEPPYNICIVIDVSGSTGGGFGGTPPGDVNGDVSLSIERK